MVLQATAPIGELRQPLEETLAGRPTSASSTLYVTQRRLSAGADCGGPGASRFNGPVSCRAHWWSTSLDLFESSRI